jgi:hypothetical protein
MMRIVQMGLVSMLAFLAFYKAPADDQVPSQPAAQSECTLTSSDYAVYSALLSDPAKIGDIATQDAKHPRLIIEQETTSSYPAEQVLAAGSAWLEQHGMKSRMLPNKETGESFRRTDREPLSTPAQTLGPI